MATFHVETDAKTDYEESVKLNCGISCVNQLESNRNLVSEKFFIQSLPFTISVDRQTKNARKGNAIEVLHVKLVVGDNISESWSSRFCVKFYVQNGKESFDYDTKHVNVLNASKSTISQDFGWSVVIKRRDFYFKVEVEAGLPNGEYKWPSRDATGYNGLLNEGATCYINSLLQSLFCTNEFRRIIYSLAIESEDFNDSFIFWLKYIFYAMQFGGLTTITTKNLIRCFDWDEMTTNDQQDIQEFLRRLIDKICQSVNEAVLKQLQSLYVGEIKTTTRCRNVDYSAINTEEFWDIQLSLDENNNIYQAFEKYLEDITIKDFKYDDGVNSGIDDAVQQIELSRMPRILYIQLKRFRYNLKTHKSTKNHKKFEFYSTLNLSKYCYTLHSVLVHSGTVNAGHYTAFICPKADDQWYKFNDEIVTKCTSEEAIDANYGNGFRTTNAYMLIYIKNTYIEQSLREVSDSDVVSKDLIVAEMQKEIEELERKDSLMEIIVFTPETLTMYDKFERGKPFFNPKWAMKQPFIIEKRKTLGDLVEFFANSFNVSNKKSFGVWYINTKNQSIQYVDEHHECIRSTMKEMFKNRKPYFFVEYLSVEETSLYPFNEKEHAMLFIKQFDSSTKTIRYLDQRYFMLTDRMGDIRAYIRQLIGFSGGDEEMAILWESMMSSETEYSHGWIVDEKQQIKRFVRNMGHTYTSTIIFEMVENPAKPPSYLFCTPNMKKIPSKENTINVTIKQGTDEISLDFQAELMLADIIERINEMFAETGHLLDSNNCLIEKDLYWTTTIKDYLEQRNSQGRTRKQKNSKNLVFTYKVFGDDAQTDDVINKSSGLFSVESEPMECDSSVPFGVDSIVNQKQDFEDIEMPDVEEKQISTKNCENVHDTTDPLKHSTSLGRSMNNSKIEQEVFLKFTDRAKNKDDIELSFSGEDSLETAFSQIIEVMDLKKHNSEFFDSKGQKISNLNTNISNFLEHHELNISYEEKDGTYLRFQYTNGWGVIEDYVCLQITESNTVGDICNNCAHRAEFLRMKNGGILSIVPPETLAISLIDDGYEYRMDEYKNFMSYKDSFFLCVYGSSKIARQKYY